MRLDSGSDLDPDPGWRDWGPMRVGPRRVVFAAMDHFLCSRSTSSARREAPPARPRLSRKGEARVLRNLLIVHGRRAGMSVVELAKATGLGRATIQDVLAGRSLGFLREVPAP